ncbi:MAG: hypothetical protein ACI4EF_03725 [Coprococcus sp.]
MWNLMKAQNYQIRRDNGIIYAILAAFILPILVYVSEGDIGKLNGCLYVINGSIGYIYTVLIITLVVTSRICGLDQYDKTMNYEVLSGHSRKEVYMARVILSIVWSMISIACIMIIPVAVISMIKGWGINVKLSEVLLRCILLFCPVFRLICIFALIAFVIGNCYMTMLVGFIGFDFTLLAAMIIGEFKDIRLFSQFASINVMKLCSIDNYRTEYIDGKDVIVYQAALTHSQIASTVFVSVIVGIICLMAGYLLFRKKDIN